MTISYLTMLGKAVSPQPASSVTMWRRPESVSRRQIPVPCCLREKLTRSARWCSQAGRMFRRGLSLLQNGPPGVISHEYKEALDAHNIQPGSVLATR